MKETMFSLRQALTAAISHDLSSILKGVESPFGIGHICCGMLDRPGSLRLSEIKLCGAGTKLHGTIHGRTTVGHEVAFRRHIRRFGRCSTLLDWIAISAYLNDAELEDGLLRSYGVAFLIGGDKPLTKDTRERQLTVKISPEVFRELVPEGLLVPYFRKLYEVRPGPSTLEDEFRSMGLIGARRAAYQCIMDDKDSVRSVCELAENYRATGVPRFSEASQEALVWTFISALQTGFVYVLLASKEGNPPTGFASGAIVHFHSEPEEKQTYEARASMPMSIVSAVLNEGQDHAETGRTVLEQLRKGDCRSFVPRIWQYQAMPGIAQLETTCETDTWVFSVIQDQLRQKFKECFAAHIIPEWPVAASLWLSLLVESLRGAIHEGQSLGFYFVVADRTQLEDSKYFDLTRLSNCSLELPFGENGTLTTTQREQLQEILEKSQREVARNNYSWFHEGRYALLWDATFPEKCPRYLVRLRQSSWDVFVASCRHGDMPQAAREAVVLAYLRADGSGGIIVEGENVLSFRHAGKWFGGPSVRERWLSAYLTEACDGVLPQEEVMQRLLPALMAVSEDPQMGCMLIVLDRAPGGAFPGMGKLWRTGGETGTEENPEGGVRLDRIEEDELIAMMAMDGATCVWREAGDNGGVMAAFRRLVKAPEVATRSLHEADSASLLSGEGSRKWSGAFAATRSDVHLVVSVSQDGPIYVSAPHSTIVAAERTVKTGRRAVLEDVPGNPDDIVRIREITVEPPDGD